MSLNKLFWQGKNVLITGHTGFIGSWMTLWLKRLGVNVMGFSKEPNTEPNLFGILRFHKLEDSYFGDIRDYKQLISVVDKLKPDIIFHLAAQPLVRASYQDPLETYQTNIMGTAYILECFRKSKSAKILINMTTDKCYENRGSIVAYEENDRLGGFDPYSSSKACSEIISGAYRDSFFNLCSFSDHKKAIATVRAGNIIGGGDWSKDRLIPDCIRSIVNKQPIYVRNPSAIRPWQFVLEPLYGYLLLAERLWDDPHKFSGAWNLGPSIEDCQTVQYIVDQVCKKWFPFSLIHKINARSSFFESSMLKLNTKKARSLIGWQSRMNLCEALDKTLSWYHAFYNYLDMVDYSLEQIDSYEQILEEIFPSKV